MLPTNIQYESIVIYMRMKLTKLFENKRLKEIKSGITRCEYVSGPIANDCVGFIQVQRPHQYTILIYITKDMHAYYVHSELGLIYTVYVQVHYTRVVCVSLFFFSFFFCKCTKGIYFRSSYINRTELWNVSK